MLLCLIWISFFLTLIESCLSQVGPSYLGALIFGNFRWLPSLTEEGKHAFPIAGHG